MVRKFFMMAFFCFTAFLAAPASEEIQPSFSVSYSTVAEYIESENFKIKILDGPAFFLIMPSLDKFWTMTQAQELLKKIYDLEDKDLASRYVCDLTCKILYQNKDLRQRYYDARAAEIFEKFNIKPFSVDDFEGWRLLTPSSVAPEDFDVEKWIIEFKDLIICSENGIVPNRSLDEVEYLKTRSLRLNFMATKTDSLDLLYPFLLKDVVAEIAPARSLSPKKLNLFILAGFGATIVGLVCLTTYFSKSCY